MLWKLVVHVPQCFFCTWTTNLQSTVPPSFGFGHHTQIHSISGSSPKTRPSTSLLWIWTPHSDPLHLWFQPKNKTKYLPPLDLDTTLRSTPSVVPAQKQDQVPPSFGFGHHTQIHSICGSSPKTRPSTSLLWIWTPHSDPLASFPGLPLYVPRKK